MKVKSNNRKIHPDSIKDSVLQMLISSFDENDYADKEFFSAIIATVINMGYVKASRLCKLLEVTPSTLNRWRNKSSHPALFVRKAILENVKQILFNLYYESRGIDPKKKPLVSNPKSKLSKSINIRLKDTSIEKLSI